MKKLIIVATILFLASPSFAGTLGETPTKCIDQVQSLKGKTGSEAPASASSGTTTGGR